MVEIKGPLGVLAMTVPPFVNLEHDETSRKVTVNVLDAKERSQREMWGREYDQKSCTTHSDSDT